MNRILREPLLHFLLLGVAIFAVYDQVSKHTNNVEPGKIVISQGQIESMLVNFTRTWQRSPSNEDLDLLIRDRVREEVYYREALELGLDKDDTVIRRRLRQKMEFVTDDLVAQIEPTDEELNAYLLAHPDVFRTQQQFTFRHVYLNPAKHGDNLARDAKELLTQLKQAGANTDTSELGDSFLLEHSFSDVPGSELAKQFGDKFVVTLNDLATGQWQGPVESGYGMHLIFLIERTAGHMPILAKVRNDVIREWTNAKRIASTDKFYSELLAKYVVSIERAEPAKEIKVAANGIK